MSVDINQYIEFREKGDGRRRPFISGTRVEVCHIVIDSESHGMDANEIALGYHHISLAAIHAALAFYHANRDEVQSMLREDQQVIDQLRTTHQSQPSTSISVPLGSQGLGNQGESSQIPS